MTVNVVSWLDTDSTPTFLPTRREWFGFATPKITRLYNPDRSGLIGEKLALLEISFFESDV